MEYGDRGDHERAEHVAEDHDGPVPVPFGQRRQYRAAEDPGQEADREGGRGAGDRAGLDVHQGGDRGLGDVVTDPGQRARGEDRPVLAVGENFTERSRPALGLRFVGHRRGPPCCYFGAVSILGQYGFCPIVRAMTRANG